MGAALAAGGAWVFGWAQGIGLTNAPAKSHPTRSKEMACGQIYQARRYHLSLCHEPAWEERILMQPQPLLGLDQ